MPIESVVVDASPLITLFKSRLEQLLPKLFDKVLVPDAVWQEVTVANQEDVAACTLPTVEWATRIKVSEISPAIAVRGLGAGESEVLSYTFNHHQYRAVIDDKAARRCARALDIRTLGTVGILLLAKQQGIISSIDPALTALKEAGLRLSEDLIREVKQKVGEDT